MTQAVSSHESGCLANCRLLHVSVHCCLVLYALSKKLVFVPVASGAHKDCLFLASDIQQLEIQHLVSRGQGYFCCPPITDRQMDNYNFNMIHLHITNAR